MSAVTRSDGAFPVGRGRIGAVSFQSMRLRAHVAHGAGRYRAVQRAPATAGLALGAAVELR
jgi:hypothetical protein